MTLISSISKDEPNYWVVNNVLICNTNYFLVLSFKALKSVRFHNLLINYYSKVHYKLAKS